MTAYRVIDREQWARKETFAFFESFDDPCLNVTVPLEARALHRYARDRGHSFFLLSLYAILRAANAVPEMRQRIVDGQIREFDRIAALTPILTPQETFCYIWCEYTPSYTAFAAAAAPLAAQAKQGIPAVPQGHGEDYICASVLPWLHFSSMTQAERRFGQSVPILAWGKMVDGVIPVACKFHHGLLDGLHFSRFFAAIGEGFAHPESLE